MVRGELVLFADGGFALEMGCVLELTDPTIVNGLSSCPLSSYWLLERLPFRKLGSIPVEEEACLLELMRTDCDRLSLLRDTRPYLSQETRQGDRNLANSSDGSPKRY